MNFLCDHNQIHISKHYISVSTLARAYIKVYNENSWHLDVRHSMVCESITHEIVYVEFFSVSTGFNCSLDIKHLVNKSMIWMSLRPTLYLFGWDTPFSYNIRNSIQCGKLTSGDLSVFVYIIPR